MSSVTKQQVEMMEHHYFGSEEYLAGPHVEAGMAQLIDPYKKRNIICTRAYAETFILLHKGWTLEIL